MFIRFSLLILVFSYSLSVNAVQRTVRIAIPSGELILTNSSPVTVTYSVNCPDKVTQANTVSPSDDLTLPSGQDHKIQAAGGGCVNGSTLNHTTPEGVEFCAKASIDFAEAQTICGGSLCTFDKLVSMGVSTFTGIPTEYWMSVGNNGTWSTCDIGGCDIANTSAPVADSGSSSRCTSGPSSSGTVGPACHSHGKTDTTLAGAVCCPANNGTAFCAVTIESDTPADGYLQSPSYKGGAPF